MRMQIPAVGNQIRLLRTWEFPVYMESRNDKLVSRLKPGHKYNWRTRGSSILCVLEKGTVLAVDRVYLRQGKNEWDSITFRIKEAPGDKKRAANIPDKKMNEMRDNNESIPQAVQKLKGARFWAKLVDVNEIYFEWVEEEE